jgi:site-specific recombinase XerD
MTTGEHHDKTTQGEVLIREFLRYQRIQNQSRDTSRTCGDVLRPFSRFLENRQKTILTAKCEDVRDYLSSGSQTDRSKARALSCLRSMYTWLILTKRITSDPTEFCRIPRTWNSTPNPLPEQALEEMLKPIPKGAHTPLGKALNLRNEAILSVMYASAIRATENITLRVEEFDRPLGRILVHGKYDRDRTVNIYPAAKAPLLRYIDEARPILALAQRRRNKLGGDISERGPLFLTRSGTMLGRDQLRKIVKRAHPDATPLRLRHSSSSHIVAHGANLEEVKDLLGHTRLGTTRGYVAYLSLQQLRDVLNRYGPHEKDGNNA